MMSKEVSKILQKRTFSFKLKSQTESEFSLSLLFQVEIGVLDYPQFLL